MCRFRTESWEDTETCKSYLKRVCIPVELAYEIIKKKMSTCVNPLKCEMHLYLNWTNPQRPHSALHIVVYSVILWEIITGIKLQLSHFTRRY